MLRLARPRDLGPQCNMKGKTLDGQARSLVPLQAGVRHSLALKLGQQRKNTQIGPEGWNIGLAVRTEGL